MTLLRRIDSVCTDTVMIIVACEVIGLCIFLLALWRAR